MSKAESNAGGGKGAALPAPHSARNNHRSASSTFVAKMNLMPTSETMIDWNCHKLKRCRNASTGSSAKTASPSIQGLKKLAHRLDENISDKKCQRFSILTFHEHSHAHEAQHAEDLQGKGDEEKDASTETDVSLDMSDPLHDLGQKFELRPHPRSHTPNDDDGDNEADECQDKFLILLGSNPALGLAFEAETVAPGSPAPLASGDGNTSARRSSFDLLDQQKHHHRHTCRSKSLRVSPNPVCFNFQCVDCRSDVCWFQYVRIQTPLVVTVRPSIGTISKAD
ncbi:hypothetical protein BCV70DRAFT_42407 [Testicularia cyperi]|uniref:Uncharacterized protein n=1 Tax=Testicularia cyperi TaxID=1882483 RepID=A0A317XJ36_9BASI|nr:hypothetical protein BCV70DRAFT_42407 [Testicularia cyperi]